MRTRAETPISFVQSILLAYEKYAVDPSHALQHALISPECLRHPSTRITAEQMEKFGGFAMRELDDEALGWFSRKLHWGSYGMLVQASVQAPTLGVALKRWCRHHGLLSEDVAFNHIHESGLITISIAERKDLGVFREFCLFSLLRNLHGYASWLIDARIPLADAAFPFPEPQHRQIYSLLFGANTSFDAPVASIAFEERYLGLPVRRDERATREMLSHALPLVVWQYERVNPIVQRVRALLHTSAKLRLNADALAAELGMSSRSLHRHLEAEGATLQQLKDDIRRDLAINILCRTPRSIKDAARTLGFSGERTFSRAFARWTGMPPTEYRMAADASDTTSRTTDAPRA